MAESISISGRGARGSRPQFPSAEEDFRRILDHVPVGIFRGTSQRLASVNVPLARMLAWSSAEEMLADDLFCADFLSRCGLGPEAPAGDDEADECLNQPIELRRRDGAIVPARLNLRAVRDVDGAFRYHEGFVESLVQVEDLEHRLREAQELAMRGQVAGGLAHDFNNIIAATLIHLSLLLQDPEMSPYHKEGLKAMLTEVERAAELTRQLLSFSRRNAVAALEPLELNRLVNSLLKIVRRVARENVLVVFLPAAEDCRIQADPGLIEMLIMNLCFLSRGALPRGGTLTLATSLLPAAEGSTDSLVCLTAKWSESAPERRAQTASLRFSRSREEREAGTYRAICEIVNLHQGRLEMPILHDRDSTVRIYFPALPPAFEEPQAPNQPKEVRGGNETLLLVEDERYLRRMTALSLRKLGYAVLEAGDEEEAAQLWEKHRQRISLLLTDYLLPGSSTGLDLARRMEREKPSLKIIIASGQGAEFERAMEAVGGSIVHLTKPYPSSQLAGLLRACLDQPADAVPAA